MTALRYRESRGSLLRRWLLATLLLTVTLPGLAATIQDDWQGVERIVAIGDIHGDYDNYMAVLKNAGVVNRRGRWAAGKTHVVQVGDIPDRGPDTLKIIEHLQKLVGKPMELLWKFDRTAIQIILGIYRTCVEFSLEFTRNHLNIF